MDDRRGVFVFRRLAAAVVCLLGPAAHAQSLQARINALLGSDQLKNASVSLHVAEIRNGKPVDLFSHNADTPLAPASNVKLLTTAAAFEKYARASFKTLLYKLGDDLLLVGAGDPALGDAKLLAEQNLRPTAPFEQMAESLKKAGIVAYRDLIVDDRVFDTDFVHPAWPENQRLSWYEAPIGGLNFNANCLDWIPKVTRTGVDVELIPDTTYVSVKIKATRGPKNEVWLWRPATANRFEMRGTVAASASAPESVTIHEPVLWTATVARDVFAAAGVKSTGEVRRIQDDNTRSAQLVADAATPVLSVIRRANKQSVNMMAEGLCKRLGHDATGQPGSWANGTAAVEAYARSLGVPAAQVSLSDGSGLSAKTRVSARAFTSVLAHVAAGRDGDLFVDTLAVPGEDGTLKRRFKDLPVAGGVHAKTGHISGVSALSGYIDVKGTRPRRFVFSILCNKYIGNVNPWQDQVCQAIYDWAD